MIKVNKTKFIEIKGNYLSFYDGKNREIRRYNKEIWTKVLNWYEVPRTESDIPLGILSETEMAALKNVLITLDLLTTKKDVPNSMERISSFYSTYGVNKWKTIEKTRILVWGCGTVGTGIIDNLVKMGIKNFLLIDPDVIEDKNIIAQSIFQTEDVGKRKVDIIEKRINSLNLGKIDINISKMFIDNINRFISLYQEYSPDVIIDCADEKDKKLDLQIIDFVSKFKKVYISTGYSNDCDYIFKISNDFLNFRMFILKSWETFGKNLRITKNRGTIIDPQLLGSLVSRMIINDICDLNKEDKIIRVDLLNLKIDEIPFHNYDGGKKQLEAK